MNNQKGISTIAGIIIIIAVAIISFGGVFAYQYFAVKTQPVVQTSQSQGQTNNVAGWKTYTNTQYGFEIKYPAVLNSENMDATDIVDRVFLQISNSADPYDILEVFVTGPKYSGGVEACNKTFDNQNYSRVKINGLDFLKGDVSSAYQSMNNPDATATAYCFVAPNGNQYTLTDIYGSSATMQGVINSFKLTK